MKKIIPLMAIAVCIPIAGVLALSACAPNQPPLTAEQQAQADAQQAQTEAQERIEYRHRVAEREAKFTKEMQESLPEGLQDCKAFFIDERYTDLYVLRCPNSTTAVDWHASKHEHNTTTFSGEETTPTK